MSEETFPTEAEHAVSLPGLSVVGYRKSLEVARYAVAGTAAQVRSSCQGSFRNGWDAALNEIRDLIAPFALDDVDFPLAADRVDVGGILRVLRQNNILPEPEE